MTEILRNAHFVLKDKAKAHLIVGDSSLYGTHIEVHKILAQIMGEIGFADINVVKIETRGNKWKLERKKQYEQHDMGTYHITAVAVH